MSIASVGSNPSQTIGSLLLQQLVANGASSQGTSDVTGLLGDLLTLSPEAQHLAQAPAAVTQALQDLLSGQKDVQGDLAQLKSYFQEHPQSLAALLNGLGASSTANSTDANSLLQTAFLNGQSNASNPATLLKLLGNQGQDSLFASLGDSGSGSDASPLSILG